LCHVGQSIKLVVKMYLPSAVTKQAEIQAAIDEVEKNLVPDVVRTRYEIGQDWSGQWAIFFRIVASDDAAKRKLRDIRTKVVSGLARQLDFPGKGVFPFHNSGASPSRRSCRNPHGPS
jgi:hypothetical protein